MADVLANATVELSEIEIEALRAAKIRKKKRTETVPDGVPTIAQAVLWIGQLGGYQGKTSPGSLTLGRGLERFLIWAYGFAYARKIEQKRDQ